MASFKPTEEQINAIEQFNSGEHSKISAYAGTGKTSTLTLVAEGQPKKAGQFLAFNRSIADDASKKFPDSVKCNSTHSLAFRAMMKGQGKKDGYPIEKMTRHANGGIIAKAMRYPRNIDVDGPVSISGRGYAYLISQVVARFNRSADREFAIRHVPALNEGALKIIGNDKRQEFRWELLDQARRVYAKMIDPSSDMPLGHDGYLKQWALKDPQIDADYVMLDEAQDTNGVVMGIMRAQKSAQLVYVGDRNQQIYAWRGAQNAMAELPSDRESFLTKSWRFGPRIAANASELLAMLGEEKPLIGNDEKDDHCSYGAPQGWRTDCKLFRTNAALLEELMDRVEKNEAPYIIGGVRELVQICDCILRLKAGREDAPQRVEHPDFFGFGWWGAVQEAAQKDADTDLQRWVKLDEKFDAEMLLECLEGLPTKAAPGQVTLSTGHKSKGLEWERVELAGDFLAGVRRSEDGQSIIVPPGIAGELRLLYVAATRGMVGVTMSPEIMRKIDMVLEHWRKDPKQKTEAIGYEEAA